MLERLQQRALDEEAPGEQVALLDAALRGPDREELPGIVPVVDRVVQVDALVALQADEPGAPCRGQGARDLRLADSGLALEQQRLVEGEREPQGRRQGAVGQVALTGQRLGDVLFDRLAHYAAAAFVSALRVSTRARWRL